MTWSDLAENKILLAVFTAVCGFLFALALEWVKSRRSQRKQLSWEVAIDDRLLQMRRGADVKKVKISYGDMEVKNLTQVIATFENTGTSVIKNQYIRFRFPEDAGILEVVLDPPPEPELGVTEVDEGKLSSLERRYLFAHLEVGQSVRYRIIADGGKWSSWSGVHPFNEEGGVEFQRRDVVRAREDEEELVPFVRASVILAFLFGVALVAPWSIGVVAVMASLPVAYFLAVKAPAVMRVLGRFLARRMDQNIVISDAQAVQIGSNNDQKNDYRAPKYQSDGQSSQQVPL